MHGFFIFFLDLTVELYVFWILNKTSISYRTEYSQLFTDDFPSKHHGHIYYGYTFKYNNM